MVDLEGAVWLVVEVLLAVEQLQKTVDGDDSQTRLVDFLVKVPDDTVLFEHECSRVELLEGEFIKELFEEGNS